jgi:tetratricopeptide (TPR) repeat protein
MKRNWVRKGAWPLVQIHHKTNAARCIARLRGVRFSIVLLSAMACAYFSSTCPPAEAQSSAVLPTPSLRDAAEALARGDLDRADTDLQEILQGTPEDFHALNLLGIVRAQQKREAEAESLFKKAIALQPDFPGAHASLGLLYVQLGKDDLAIGPLEDALKLDPSRKDTRSVLVSVWRRQAHADAERGDSEKALALLIQARRVSPEDHDVEYDLGMVALRGALFSDAIDAFEQALKLKPDDSSALYALGRAEISIAQFDQAERAFERYIAMRPDDASGHYALGMTLQAMQNYSAAHAEYEKSILLQPQQTESFLQLGLMDLDSGNLSAAQQKFERILRRAPQHAAGLTALGKVKFQEKLYGEAVPLFEKAIASNPDSREAHYYLGLADSHLGKKEEADKELQIASRLEHAEVEKHQNGLKILDPDQVHVDAGSAP